MQKTVKNRLGKQELSNYLKSLGFVNAKANVNKTSGDSAIKYFSDSYIVNISALKTFSSYLAFVRLDSLARVPNQA
jgi:hypothetical protein